jgi:hypothetical protein
MNYNISLDEAVNFLLSRSRDDKENSSKYLSIIKLLYSTTNSGNLWHINYGTPNISYCNKKDDDIPDWTVTSCQSGSNIGTASNSTNRPIIADENINVSQLSSISDNSLNIKSEVNDLDVFKNSNNEGKINEPDELPF